MKDYTKYDFAAIVGAEVEMKVRDGKGSCWNVKGKIRLQDNGLVWVERTEGKPWNDCIIIREIIPDSLSAKIKVEDMSLKQLHSYYKAFAEREGYEDYVVVIRGGEVEEPSNRITYSLKRMDAENIEEFGPWTKDVDEPLDDYIDCTDWGWKE